MSMTSNNVRISVSLVCLMLFIIYVANEMGLIPDENAARIRERIKLAETLAVPISEAIKENNIDLIELTLKSMVQRDSEIKSISVRKSDASILTGYGNYPDSGIIESTPDAMTVPIFMNDITWGAIEIYFTSIDAGNISGFFGSTIFKLLGFIGLFGFVIYYFIVRKLLLYLDPYKVIPVRVKKALNAVSDGIVFIDSNERIVLSNVAFERKINIDASLLTGMKLSSLTWSQPTGARIDNGSYPWSSSLLHGKDHNSIAVKIQPPNNKPLTLLVSSTALQDGKGHINGALVSFNDVTEFEKVSKDLENMTRFLRHEMGNALVGAAGMVSLLEKSESLSADDKHLVASTQRLHQVIKYLLNSVQEAKSIESSFAKEKSVPQRLDILIADLVSNYTDIYSSNSFVFDTDGHGVVVLGQEARLIQMLDKLVTNAIEHSFSNTPIIVSCHKEDQYACIKVSNAGEVLPEDKNAIFDLFTSFGTEVAGKQNQGIGLYVVKLIAEAYGGTVQARDRVDVSGAEFIIRLPLVN